MYASKVNIKNIAIALVAVLFAAAASAERYHASDGYIIHYNALRSDILSQDVARTYGIVRSTNRAFVNISVHKTRSGQDNAVVGAKVTATATNLNGQLRKLKMRELSEGQEGLYYIAEMPISNEDIIDYRVEVTPSGLSTPIGFEFQQQFFTD
ncbi:MAG: DUF4426 domain-containing protein [Candidatus Porifericomitaceae bacterium WSBS_2022_MAG_OTU9]